MSRDPRSELKFLAGQVRAELERENRAGRRFTAEPELVTWTKSAPPAPAARNVAGRAAGASSEPPARAARAAAAAGTPVALPAAGKAASPSVAAPAASAAGRPAAPPADRGAKALPPVGLPKSDGRDLERLAEELAAFSAEAAQCVKCGLCETRTNVVYGSGSARQPLLFVGEAPGFNEDQQGLPFVGRAGKLLTDIIAAAGFERSEVYIANLLKCRPPENRDPLPHESEACRPWLERQIEIIRPRVICTLGKFSAQLLTGNPKATIGILRGKIHHYNGIPVVPTYHPAFLLRSPSNKRATWDDVQLVREIYLAADSDADRGA